jgi:hypothetical protein
MHGTVKGPGVKRGRRHRPRRSRHLGQTGVVPAIRMCTKEQNLANLARKMAMNRTVLFHGTRYAQSILSTGILLIPPGCSMVSFTRSPEEAARWAFLERDDDEAVRRSSS